MSAGRRTPRKGDLPSAETARKGITGENLEVLGTSASVVLQKVQGQNALSVARGVERFKRKKRSCRELMICRLPRAHETYAWRTQRGRAGPRIEGPTGSTVERMIVQKLELNLTVMPR